MRFLEEVLAGKEESEKTAIIQENREISYRNLTGYSNKMANLLELQGVGKHKVIIFLDKSIEAVISMFAILKAGAAYVPLDYTLPPDRLKFIIEDCQAQVVITDTPGLQKLKEIPGDKPFKVLLFDKYNRNSEGEAFPELSQVNWESRGGENCHLEVDSSLRDEKDIAYIIYTSGSTGKPKGVMIRHNSVTAFCHAVLELVPYDEHTRYLNVSPLYFDASIVDLYCTFMVKGTVVLMKKFVWPNEIVTALEKYQITDTLLVSSVLKLLVSRFSNLGKARLPCLKTIWYGAEPCPVGVIRELKGLLPQLKFIHGYGPTEATHSTTLYIFREVPEEASGFLPIGKPLPTIKAYALNEQNQLIKPGEIGELFIGGIQVMEGYCNDPERTREVLVASIFDPEEMVYKSGDYVTVDEHGNFCYCGRRDDMIKTGGHLVHLSEIEKVLLRHSLIKDAIVLPVQDDLFNTKIRAFIVRKDEELDEEALKAYLLQKLPKYMLPNSFKFLTDGNIPRKESGKIDREALLTGVFE